MHERSLVRSLLSQVLSLRAERGAERVAMVRVSVGEFSGIEPALFRSAFDELVDDSLICGAQLELRVTPLEARCLSCACEFAVENFRFTCPRCKHSQVDIVRGEGLVLESVTLEEDDDRQELG